MKLLHACFILVAGTVLYGCASDPKSSKNTPATAQHTTHSAMSSKKIIKNPINVTLYTGSQKPEKPYVVLAHETVSKYNKVGIKRQEANLRDSIRHLAADQGGDAVIEIINHPDTVSYTIISYQSTNQETSLTKQVS